MFNREAYEEICEKAKKYDKLKEAWEKVKAEIKNAKPVYPDRVRIWGTDTIIGIIDKHLKEVSE